MRKNALTFMFLSVCAVSCGTGGQAPVSSNDAATDGTSVEMPKTPTVQDSMFVGNFTSQPDATTVQTAQRKTPDLIFGDSIANGIQTASGLPGNTKVGQGPRWILNAIQAWPREDLQGKNVILTCGAGNNPSQVNRYVPQQMKYLKDAGANVIVMGVSEIRPDIDGPATNKRIEAFAKQFGCTYGGPVSNPTPRDSIHSKDYNVLYKQATDSLNKVVSVPVRPANNAPTRQFR